MSFRAWRIAEGERLYQAGVDSLSLVELLTYILRDDKAARALLERFSGIRELGAANYEELVKVHRISTARAEQILAAFELGKRWLSTPTDEKASITSPEEAYKVLRAQLTHRNQETFVVLLLNSKNTLIRIHTVSVGTLDASIVHPREVFEPAIRASASAIILAHNHPSGDPTPSREDIALTKRLAKVAELVGIELLDHVVVGDNRYLSLKEKGCL